LLNNAFKVSTYCVRLLNPGIKIIIPRAGHEWPRGNNGKAILFP